MRGFNKLPKLIEENDRASSLEQILDEPIKEYLNSKFYLPSTDLNDNLLVNDSQQQEKSRNELIAFLSTNGRIFCNECNSQLRTTSDNGICTIDEKVLEADDKLKRTSSVNNSICSLHNPPTHQTACLTDPTFTISATSKLEIHPQKSDRQILEESIVGLFINGNLKNDELQVLHLLVDRIINSTAGLFMFDNFSRIIINKGLHQLKLKFLENNTVLSGDILKGKQLIDVLIDVWGEYFRQIIPIVDCIFYRLKDRHNLSIRKICLKSFRDEIVLKIKLKDALKDRFRERKLVPKEIKQMLLILTTINDKQSPDTKLDPLCSMVISPFLSFKGLYIDGKLEIKSKEPGIYASKKLSETKLLKVRPHSLKE